MPPKASNANSSTVNAAGQPKRKRTRNRNRNRNTAKTLDLSSSDDSSSSEEETKTVSSLWKRRGLVFKRLILSLVIPGTIKTSKAQGKVAAVASSAQAVTGKSLEEAESSSESEEESDSSSSSSSSFLSSSSASSSRRPPNRHAQRAQQAQAANGYAPTNPFQDSETATQSRRQRSPSPTRPASPPHLLASFTPEAEPPFPGRVAGKPILWGLVRGDAAGGSSDTSEEKRKEHEEAEEQAYLAFRSHYMGRLISRFGSSLDAIRQKEGSDLKEDRLRVLIRSVADGSDAFTTSGLLGSKDGGIWGTKRGRGERELVNEGLKRLPKDAEADGVDEDVEMA